MRILILIINFAFSYEFTTFSEMTFPLGMKDDGTVVVGTDFYERAIIWTVDDGAMIIGDGEFWGVADDGKVSGSLKNNQGLEEAVIWQDGELTWLGNIPNGNSCDAFLSSGLSISADGSTVVGMGWQNCSVEAYAWNAVNGIVGLGQWNGNNTKAQAVNGNGSIIGGWAEANSGTRQSCVWDGDGNITLLGSLIPSSNYGEVTAISNDGSKIIGFSAGSGNNHTEAYLATPSADDYELTGLGVPNNFAGTNESHAFDISENNVIVGQYTATWGMDGMRAAIWTEELGTMVDLKDYLSSLGINDFNNWDFLKALCISDDGTIISGTALNSFGNWATYILDISDELGSNIAGDVNGDETVDILDVITLVNHILDSESIDLNGADLNNDGFVNILDIIEIINIILDN